MNIPKKQNAITNVQLHSTLCRRLGNLGSLMITVFFIIQFSSCQSHMPFNLESQSYFISMEAKQRGAHVFSRIDTHDLTFLKRNNIEWITMVPWGYQEKETSSELSHYRYNHRIERWISRITQYRSAGFKIFIKPHVWISDPSDGKWRSDISHKDSVDWAIWKENYRDFILSYAQLAEDVKAEMYCVGTELTNISLSYPSFFRELIVDVRKIYSGKLTYAANWYKEFEDIKFWDDLDYIGVQAYFPLTDNDNPSLSQVSEGWDPYILKMKNLSQSYNRSILFTEMGYKSTADSAREPWSWIESEDQDKWQLSESTQEHCYQAFFDKIWPQNWFAGVHIWQMRGERPRKSSRYGDLDFTPLGKPAEKVLEKGFKRVNG